MSILGYVNETLFEKKYGIIAHLIRIPVQILVVKALMHFWNLGYRCFTFMDIDMTLIIKEYV